MYYTADGSGSPATGTISSCFDCQSSCYNNNACYDWSWEGGSKYSYSDSSGCTGERVKGVLRCASKALLRLSMHNACDSAVALASALLFLPALSPDPAPAPIAWCRWYAADNTSLALGPVADHNCSSCQSSCFFSNTCAEYSWQGGSRMAYNNDAACTGASPSPTPVPFSVGTPAPLISPSAPSSKSCKGVTDWRMLADHAPSQPEIAD